MSNIWHPMTQHKIFPEMIRVDRGEGAYLYASDGRKILDGISSWWVNTHGHCHPHIVAKVQEQAAKLEQVIFAGFTHEPAEELTEKMLARTRTHLGAGGDSELAYAFFSDSGSTAIEVALKMAIGYFTHTGDKRTHIVALENGYHGDTFGTMAAGARGVFNEVYDPFLFDVHHLPFPDANNEGHCLAAFKQILEQHKVAALVLEPLVQGAAGMQIYSAGVLKKLSDLCKAHGALLIADEVMTGFGRTGTFFACEQAGIVPDLLCLSKGLTGGFLPMGLTLATKQIYDAFYGDSRMQQFFHSTSFSGNPLACASAVASLEIWDEEPVQERIDTISAVQKRAGEEFAGHPKVNAVRQIGTILAIDVKDETSGYLSNLGVELYEKFLAENILLRPIGNCIYILPPYCVNEEELDMIYSSAQNIFT